MSITKELHQAYLEGNEPKVKTLNPFKHNKPYGRWWQRGDVVHLNNKEVILITGSHPKLTYAPYTVKTRLRYFFEEAKTLFCRIMFRQKPANPPGWQVTTKTDGLSIYVQTLPPDAPVAQ